MKSITLSIIRYFVSLLNNVSCDPLLDDVIVIRYLYSNEHCPPPPLINPLAPPPHIVRAILLYSRAQCLPVFQGDAEVREGREREGRGVIAIMISVSRQWCVYGTTCIVSIRLTVN